MPAVFERTILSAWGPPIVLTILLLPCLLHGTSLEDQRLAFRDVGFFYTPLYEHVARFDELGTGPVWNSLDATGMPLAGETTTAVFYPVRWIIYRCIASPTRAMATYVWLHFVFASLTARWLAVSGGRPSIGSRKSNRSALRAAAVAGWIYPMSGGVVFLVTNPPFLVSAAWLPVALIGLIRKRFRIGFAIIATAISLAMMVLAGDPQTALHAVMILSLAVIAKSIDVRQRTIQWRTAFQYCLAIGLAGLLAGCLAAPQIAASIDWSLQSDRASGIAASQRYLYSLAPWRFAEWLAPFASGPFFPINQRITATIPGDGAMWTPSIFASCVAVPALLAGVWRRQRQWVAITGFASLAAMGHFGFAWWIQSATGQWNNVPSEFGGVYDLICRWIPGYHSFRYPAKWLPPVSLGMAILATQLLRDRSYRRWRWTISATALAFVVALAWNEAVIRSAQGSLVADEFWGPLQIGTAANTVRRSYLLALIALGILAALVNAWHHRRISFRTLRIVTVFVVAFQMATFASNMIPMVAIEPLDAPATPDSISDLSSTTRGATTGAWMRYSDAEKWPTPWRDRSDSNRLVDVESSLRASRFGRWHLADNLPVFNSMFTMNSAASRTFWDDARRDTQGLRSGESSAFWKEKRATLGAAGAMDEQGTVTGVRCEASFYPEVNQWLRYDAKDMTVANLSARGHEATYHVVARIDSSLTRPVYQDGHWQAHVNGPDAPELHVVRKGLLQSIAIPKGEWTIRLTYSPWWWRPSIALSWLTVVGMAVGVLGARRRAHR